MNKRIFFAGSQAYNPMRRTSLILLLMVTAVLSFYNLSGVVQAASGDLDASFGTQGRVVTRFFNNSQFGYGDRASAQALAIQPDGLTIIAAFKEGNRILPSRGIIQMAVWIRASMATGASHSILMASMITIRPLVSPFNQTARS
jgi:hypothetical protein